METRTNSVAIYSKCVSACAHVAMMIPLKMILDCCDVTSGSLMRGEGREYRCYKKAWRSVFCGGLLSSCASVECVCVRVSV